MNTINQNETVTHRVYTGGTDGERLNVVTFHDGESYMTLLNPSTGNCRHRRDPYGGDRWKYGEPVDEEELPERHPSVLDIPLEEEQQEDLAQARAALSPGETVIAE